MKSPPDIAIVLLDPSQIEAAARLFHEVWHETQAQLQDARIARHRDLAFFRNRVSERAARTCVAMVDGRCAGLTSWTGGKLNSLFVDGRLRARGIGGLLCAEAERQMTLGGAQDFWLDCLDGNFAARRFYEARGWRFDSRRIVENLTPDGLCKVSAWKMVKP